MSESGQNNKDDHHHKNVFYKIEWSALITFIGIVFLFSFSVVIVLIAPRYVDPTWTTPTSSYQVQMYEISDPNLYISSTSTGSPTLQSVYHLKDKFTLLAFHETQSVRIVAPPELEKFITKFKEPTLKLTSKLMMLRKPQKTDAFDAIAAADKLRKDFQDEAVVKEVKEASSKKQKTKKANFEIFELFVPGGSEAFAVAPSEGAVENWVDENYRILDETVQHRFHAEPGVIYVNNPQEYRVSHYVFNDLEGWRYDPEGEPIKDFSALKSHSLKFLSRAELISLGEHIYAIEGCWYCHTDQTRTLVQDVVLNGSDSYPAPPSSASEYIYQKITFPGTRRIGPDMSRVAIKRPSRDWHKGHFWSPKTASEGSIMPSFRHFFDFDPRGTSKNTIGVPNYQFEAVYQYLMTKGTRITPPTQAWWLGKDPIKTKEIIEGNRVLPP